MIVRHGWRAKPNTGACAGRSNPASITGIIRREPVTNPAPPAWTVVVIMIAMLLFAYRLLRLFGGP